jgi:hypothetical protein
MVKRRKMLIGMGALAAGTTASVGTGAFTSASIPDRSVTAQVDGDASSQIALVAGDDPDITQSDGTIELDLSGSDGEGVNINSLYTWGNHNNPSSDFAFKLVNNDEQAYNVVEFTYDVRNDSWIDEEGTLQKRESFLKFTAYNIGGNAKTKMRAPEAGLDPADPRTKDMLEPHSDSIYDFGSGDTWYVVVDANTTGVAAGTEDDLTGTLTIDVSDPVPSGGT